MVYFITTNGRLPRMKKICTIIAIAIASKLLPYCAFCDNEIITRQKYYEDDQTVVLYTHKPVLKGHSLIIPKRHVERCEDLTESEITAMHNAMKKVHSAASSLFNTSAYLIFQKTGAEAGQSVPHAHMHYIPMDKGDASTISFMTKMFLSELSSPISQSTMNEMTAQFQNALTGEINEKTR
jgi:histidine triad (HIT) family protein